MPHAHGPKMPVQFPVDKLALVNRALATTGNNICNAEEDGSDEWTVCSPAYEEALAFMLEDHGWVHATKVVANLPRSATPPTDNEFDSAYDLPNDLLHLIWVRLDDSQADYDILANQIVLQRFNSGVVSIKYVSSDNSDSQDGTPTFVAALTSFVKAGIFSGLEGDREAGAKERSYALAILQAAKTRSDQQKPKRAVFNSRLGMARRVRRPWWSTPPGWSGTGNP